MELCSLCSFFPWSLFLHDPWGWYLINSDITKGFTIQALSDGNNNSLSLWTYQLLLNKFQYSTHILGSFVGDELYENFDVVLFSLIFEGDLLIECEFIGWGGGDLAGDGVASKFKVYFAGEFYFEGKVEYVEGVAVDFYLSLDWHWLNIRYGLNYFIFSVIKSLLK